MDDSSLRSLSGHLPTAGIGALRKTQGIKLSAQGERPTAEEALDTAKKFEALLVNNMLKAMRSTTFAEDGGQDQSMYYDMLDERLATIVTENGGMGLAESLARQMQLPGPPADSAAATLEHLRTSRSLRNDMDDTGGATDPHDVSEVADELRRIEAFALAKRTG